MILFFSFFSSVMKHTHKVCSCYCFAISNFTNHSFVRANSFSFKWASIPNKSLVMHATKTHSTPSSIAIMNRTISYWMMMFSMFRIASYFKIFYSVIKFFTIFMMNKFASLKLSTKMLFHYQSMFINLTTVCSRAIEASISVFLDGTFCFFHRLYNVTIDNNSQGDFCGA